MLEGRAQRVDAQPGMKRCRVEGAERFALFVGAAVLAMARRKSAMPGDTDLKHHPSLLGAIDAFPITIRSHDIRLSEVAAPVL
jgi:hypothetical protein